MKRGHIFVRITDQQSATVTSWKVSAQSVNRLYRKLSTSPKGAPNVRNYVEYFWRGLNYTFNGGSGNFAVVNGDLDDWEESVFREIARWNVGNLPGFAFTLDEPIRQYVLLDKDQVLAICQLNGGFAFPGHDPADRYSWITTESPRKTWSHGE